MPLCPKHLIGLECKPSCRFTHLNKKRLEGSPELIELKNKITRALSRIYTWVTPSNRTPNRAQRSDLTARSGCNLRAESGCNLRAGSGCNSRARSACNLRAGSGCNSGAESGCNLRTRSKSNSQAGSVSNSRARNRSHSTTANDISNTNRWQQSGVWFNLPPEINKRRKVETPIAEVRNWQFCSCNKGT